MARHLPRPAHSLAAQLQLTLPDPLQRTRGAADVIGAAAKCAAGANTTAVLAARRTKVAADCWQKACIVSFRSSMLSSCCRAAQLCFLLFLLGECRL